jgi:hypothetical protein
MLDACYIVTLSLPMKFDFAKTYPFPCELLDFFFVARYHRIELLGCFRQGCGGSHLLIVSEV